MSEYWLEGLEEAESRDNTAPVEHFEGQFVFDLEPSNFDPDDLPVIAPKCEGCPVQRILRARAAQILVSRDEPKRFLLALMGEQGEAFDMYLGSRMSPEEVASKKSKIIADKEEALEQLDQELEEIQLEMTGLSWNCFGVRRGQDESIGRPIVHYTFCDSELVSGAEDGQTSPAPAYIWTKPSADEKPIYKNDDIA